MDDSLLVVTMDDGCDVTFRLRDDGKIEATVSGPDGEEIVPLAFTVLELEAVARAARREIADRVRAYSGA